MPPPARVPPITGVTIPTYPTPLIADTIEVEVVDSVAGRYEPIEFGTRYSEVEHGAFAKDLPNHVLVADVSADASGTMRRRTWVSDRIDQDQYNFAISFENNDPVYPNYTRVYVLRREGYEPLELLSEDPYDPFAFLIAEQLINETEPAELRNAYVKVVRIYATLPGPIAYSIEYPYGGNPNFPRITTKQKFGHMEFAQLPGTRCPLVNYTNAVLVAQTIQQTEYAAVDLVNRIYDDVPEVELGDKAAAAGHEEDFGGQEKYGFSVGYMYGMKAFPFVTWRFSAPVKEYAPSEDLSACPIAGFEKLRLVNQEAPGDDKQSVILRVERRYETLPGPLISKVDYDNNDPAFPIVTTAQRVAVNEYDAGTVGFDTCTVPRFTNLVLAEQHLAPVDYGVVREDQRIFELNPSSIIRSYDYDSTVDVFVETKRQKVIAGPPSPLTDPLIVEFRENPVDRYRTIQIQSRLLELPKTRVEFKTANNWPFPTLLTGISLTKTTLVANRAEVVWFPNTLRPIQNVPAILRVTTSYHTSTPPPETIFVLPTRNIVYRGVSFEISISNVLSDKITLSVTFITDSKYGGLTEAVTFAATNPTATQYYAQIGQYKIVGCDISIWRGRINVKTLTEVILV